MSGHDDVAADAERELADLEERTDKLGEDLEQARDQLVDPGGDSTFDQEVEGAVGDHPEEADEPEAGGTPKGWA